LREFINQNWLTIIIAALGVAASYYFYLRAKVLRRVFFVTQSVQVTGVKSEFAPDLEIFYRGKKVDRVTKSVLYLWNSGNTTIEGNQIVGADPLRLACSEGCEILKESIVRVTRDVIAIDLRRDSERPNELIFHFDFLDPGDGAVIDMLHTGDRKVRLTGTIRGIPQGFNRLNSLPSKIDMSLFFWMSFFALFGLAGVIYSVILFLGKGFEVKLLATFVLFLLFSAGPLYVIWKLLFESRIRPKKLIEKD
jgi:hypothetical protein